MKYNISELQEFFNATHQLIIEVLTLQGIQIHVIHDSITLINGDDAETIESHLAQLHDIRWPL